MTRCEVVQQHEQPTAVVHQTLPVAELPSFFARAFGQVSSAIRAQGVQPVGPPFAMYFGVPQETVEVEAGFPVARPVKRAGAVTAGHLPETRCVHATHIGPYETMAQTYGEMRDWMREQDFEPQAEMWEVYLSDPRSEPDPAKWRTEIVWPVE